MTDNKKTVRDFSLSLRAFGEQIPATALAVQQAVALKGLAGVVRKSPVDTGRFRGNWQVQTTASDPAPIKLDDKAPRGSGPSAAVQAAAEAAIAGAKPYGTIYIVNGLPYAQRLEDGYSQQAPGGMVALTLAELQAEVQGAAAP